MVNYLLNKLDLESEFYLSMDIQQEITSVRDDLLLIKCFLRRADSLMERDDEVKVWVEQIRELAHHIEDVLDEFKLLSTQGHGGGVRGLLSMVSYSVRNRKAQYRIKHEIRCFTSRMKRICEGHKRLQEKFDRAGQRLECNENLWQEHRGDALLLDKSDLVGIEEPKMQLIKWLLEGPLVRESVSVVGMGGLGKTTLAKQVYDDPAIKKHFKVHAWITLSPSSRTEDVLKDLLEQIVSQIRKPSPRRADTSSSAWLKLMIKGCLLNKRYLIVLDDVWQVEKWDAVKYAFPSAECGSRVMITTRHADVATASFVDYGGNIHTMKPLPDEDSWELFCRKTFQGNSCPTNLECICRFILDKCEGLPLPIVAISGVLASKDTSRVVDWDLVRRTFRAEINDNDRLKKVDKVLSLSFSDLPYYLKSCFLLFSVFPEGHAIESMKLLRLWVAEGFIEAKQGKTLEEVAEEYLNELLNRSLLQVAETSSDGRVKTCHVHHLFKDIAVRKSSEQNFAAAVVANEQSLPYPEKVRRLSIQNNSQPLQQNWSLSRLRSLFMSGVEKSSVKATLARDLKLLHILDLQGAPLRRFPVQVVDMHYLKYLSLRNSAIKAIPSWIGQLVNLETLDLKHTYVTDLPVEITKLIKLRHLPVYRYETVSYSHTKYGFRTPADLGSLQSLQKLAYIEADDDRSHIVMRQLGRLTQLRRLCILKLKKEDGAALCLSISCLSNLRAFSVSALDEEEVLDLQNLSPPPFLEKIYLSGRLLALPKWLPTLDSLVKMHLRWSRLKQDPLPFLQSLPNLVHLELQVVYDWKVLSFKSKGFKKLKWLGLDDFVELRHIEMEEGAMPSLVQLIIQRCKSLQHVPSGIQHLSKLRVLEFLDVHEELVQKLKQDIQSEDYGRVSHIPELRYGSWTDGGWDVISVDRSYEEVGSCSGNSIRSRIELPSCWK